jgi:hypothetical protein
MANKRVDLAQAAALARLPGVSRTTALNNQRQDDEDAARTIAANRAGLPPEAFKHVPSNPPNEFDFAWSQSAETKRIQPSIARYWFNVGSKEGFNRGMAKERAYALQKAPAVLDDAELREAIAEGLRDMYGCLRQWSAWNHGNMTEADFVAADETPECIDQVVGAIKEAMAKKAGK